MNKILFIFLMLPFLLYSQSKRDYKRYREIVELINQEDLEEAKLATYKLIDKNEDWKKPHLLLALIYEQQRKFTECEYQYLLVYDIEKRSSADPLFDLALIFYDNGYYQDALKYFNVSKNLGCKSIDIDRFLLNCNYSISELSKDSLLSNKYNNLGESINSKSSEYLPYISANGRELIFTRIIEYYDESSRDLKSQEDLYLSLNRNGVWETAYPLPINTLENEGAVSISPDQMTLVFTACNRIDGFGSCDIYMSYKQDNGVWGEPVNIGGEINTINWESQPCFSADGNYLYFVSNRYGGFGGNDIWRSRFVDGYFSDPENLGPFINTKYDEMSPFLHSDNVTLYFASEGHVGFGDFDLFISRRINSEQQWMKVNNLGYPVNSYKSQTSLVVGPDGETAYFTSNSERDINYGEEDIYSFRLSKSNQSNKINDLEMDIITNQKGADIILPNVLFELDSYILYESSFTELDNLLVYLRKNPNVNIHIQGHTDNIGDKDYNLLLSIKRAEQILNYLIDKGIDNKRLTYNGCGEDFPIASNDTEEGRMKNRRTTINISQ